MSININNSNCINNNCDFSFCEYEHIDEENNSLHKIANVIKHLAEIYSEINFVELNHDDIETKIEFYKERNYDKRD